MPKPKSSMAIAASPAIPKIRNWGFAARLGNTGLHRLGQIAFLAEVADAIPEARAKAGEAMPPGDPALGVFAGDLVDEQVLQGHDLAFHAHHFRDMGDLARTVAQA